MNNKCSGKSIDSIVVHVAMVEESSGWIGAEFVFETLVRQNGTLSMVEDCKNIVLKKNAHDNFKSIYIYWLKYYNMYEIIYIRQLLRNNFH